jgi:hypothetical protein
MGKVPRLLITGAGWRRVLALVLMLLVVFVWGHGEA